MLLEFTYNSRKMSFKSNYIFLIEIKAGGSYKLPALKLAIKSKAAVDGFIWAGVLRGVSKESASVISNSVLWLYCAAPIKETDIISLKHSLKYCFIKKCQYGH